MCGFFSLWSLIAVRTILLLISLALLPGCAVVSVADAVVTVAATGVSVAAKTTGAVIDAAIPDSDQTDGQD